MIAVKTIGIFLIVIAILLSYVVYSYTQDILEKNKLLHQTCPLPPDVCPYKQTLPTVSYLGFSISGLIGFTGLYLTFTQQRLEKLAIKEKSKLTKTIRSLDVEEKKIYQLLESADGSMFQNDLITKTGFSKVKTSRILDKLETKGIVERRRRGMANIIVLKV